MADQGNQQAVQQYQAQIQQLQIKQMSANPQQYQELSAQINELKQKIAYITSFGG